MIGIISRVKTLLTKKNEKMAFLTVDVNYHKVDAVLFSEPYKLFENVLDSKKMVLINAVVKMRNGSLQLQINKMREL